MTRFALTNLTKATLVALALLTVAPEAMARTNSFRQRMGASFRRNLGKSRTYQQSARRSFFSAFRGNKGAKAQANEQLRMAIKHKVKSLNARKSGMENKLAEAKRAGHTDKVERLQGQIKSIDKRIKRLGSKRFSRRYKRLQRASFGHQQAGEVKKSMELYKQTGDAKHLQAARKAGLLRLKNKIKLSRMQAKDLRRAANKASKRGDSARATLLHKQAEKLEIRSSKLASSVARFKSKLRAGTLKAPKTYAQQRAAAKRRAAARADDDGPDSDFDGPDGDFDGPDYTASDPDGDGIPNSGAATAGAYDGLDNEPAPGVDGPEMTQPKIDPIKSRRGLRAVKSMMRDRNMQGALDTLEGMKAGKRGGVMGLLDSWRIRRSERRIRKGAMKYGKQALKNGNILAAETARDAVHATSRRQTGWRYKRRMRVFSKTAMKQAHKFASSPEAAQMLVDFASTVERSLGTEKVSRSYRRSRRSIIKKQFKVMKKAAKSGDVEQFRAAKALAEAMSQEIEQDGGHRGKLSGRQLRKISKWELTADKKSVKRQLKEAKALMKQAGQNPEALEMARQKVAYAEQTKGELATKHGVNVRTGRKIGKLKDKMDKAERNMRFPKKPSLFMRWWSPNARGGMGQMAAVPRSKGDYELDRKSRPLLKALTTAKNDEELTGAANGVLQKVIDHMETGNAPAAQRLMTQVEQMNPMLAQQMYEVLQGGGVPAGPAGPAAGPATAANGGTTTVATPGGPVPVEVY